MLMLYCVLYQVCDIVRFVSAYVICFWNSFGDLVDSEMRQFQNCSKLCYCISEIANLTNSALDVEWNVFYGK